jgi:hypothetical protein
MPRIILVYGAIAGAIVISTIAANIAYSDVPPHEHSVWVGYLVMLIGLSLVFVGIKQYRDRHLGGVIRFGTALLVGLGISVVAGAVYVAGWEAYLAVSDSDFMAQYAQGMIESEQARGVSGAELEALREQMSQLVEQYKSPWFRMPLTFLEIFPVGVLVTLVSAALLRNPRVLLAR